MLPKWIWFPCLPDAYTWCFCGWLSLLYCTALFFENWSMIFKRFINGTGGKRVVNRKWHRNVVHFNSSFVAIGEHVGPLFLSWHTTYCHIVLSVRKISNFMVAWINPIPNLPNRPCIPDAVAAPQTPGACCDVQTSSFSTRQTTNTEAPREAATHKFGLLVNQETSAF